MNAFECDLPRATAKRWADEMLDDLARFAEAAADRAALVNRIRRLIDIQDCGYLFTVVTRPPPRDYYLPLSEAHRARVNAMLAAALVRLGGSHTEGGITYYAENGIAKRRVGP